ncbi:uncharacterized protein LOC5567456 isoform X2 [Aedes aegypti]|uniref:Arginine kinase n=1 Tax=Aedes aegypti TaxID=7159 RepID=A0A6I8TWB5_AEDAE|nr:uncharacterized protein LOC5567456 isoform X2 [Aedes aegypti]
MVVPKIAPAPIQPTKMAPPGPPRERRRKTHGLYFHSSPPKVLQMNNQNVQRDNDSRIKDGLVIKPSNIRIWLHQKHLAKLAKVIWAGQGMRLRTETSHHPKMKRFLECVPHVMGVIKDIHQAVVDNDLDTLKAKTASPTPRIVLTSKDANGLTPLHKAAGLAHTQIVEYILSIWPSLSSDEDHTGKTPLHWAASAKNNARSFNLLVQAGADETALDHRDKAAEYYKNRPNEIDRSLLTVIPEAPRISQQGFPACFDWTMFTLDEDTDDSNGSQTRMKPFLSQNNLLDNDVNNYNSVSKSKSVHNLTNGTLTDLPNDESESETKNKEGSTAEEQDEEPEANQQESTGGDAGDESEDVNGDENGDDGAEPTNGNDGNNEAEPAGEKTESESVEDNETTAATDQNQEATGDSQESENGPEKEEEGIINEANQQQEANQEQEGELNKAETDERDLSTENEVNEKELIESGKINGINGENEEDRDDEGNTENMVEEKDTVESKNVDDLKQNEETQGAGELTNDSLESNPSKENEDSEEIEQDSLNKPDEEVADTPLDGDFNKIVDNDNVSRMSATSRQSSAISQTGTGKVSRSTTATRDLSARTIQADENGYASDVKSRQSSAQSERITEAIINEVFSSRPESGLNGMNNGSSKNSAKSTMSRRESAKSISVASNKTKSAASKHDGNNNEFDEETNGNDAEPATSRPSTIASRTTNEHEQAEQSNSPRTQSSSTVRNVSATSVIERRPSAKSTTSQKSRTADDEEEGDSNDDSNQADVQIVHYKSGDEDGHDENDQSNEQPQSTAVNGNGYENGTQNDQNIKVAVEEPPVDSESTLRHLEASPKLTETDPDAGNATEEDEQQEKVESPSPAMEIKGTVEGEPDGGQLHSARPSGNLDSFNGQSIQETIDSGDMEQLAVIVLDGEGGKLLGRHSNQPEIQAFLDNVPSYMNKIRRVHVAAREGSIRDLQSALDRRKFATAKDSISPHGATPLHVATIFGHSGIIRYLAGRFPETTSATDNNGRTPLHYAATLKDNGHFYNLLNHLGANPKVEDNSNHSAEYYLDHEKAKDLLSHRQLLQDYGADEDLADSMFNDQVPDDQHSARRELDDVDTLTTLERCFKIIHEPVDELMKSVRLPTNSVPGSASSLRILITSYLARFMKRSVFDKIKKRQTKLDHNLFDVIWPAMKKATKEKKIDEDLNVGIVIPDYDVFVVFQEFLVPLIKDMHCMELQQEFVPHPQMQFFPQYVLQMSPNQNGESNGNVLRENPSDVHLNLDTSGKFITGVVIECARNLDEFDFPLNLSIAQLEKAERILTSKILSMAFATAIGEEELGTYYTMNEILENPSEIRTILATSGLLIPMLDHNDPYQTAESIALNGKYWPYGRGVYVSHMQDLVAWINAQEHLRVLCCTSSKNPANMGSAYSKIGRAMTFLDDKIHFKHSYFLGYLVSRPSFLGTGLKMTLFLELPHLRKERENLRHLCVVRGLHLLTSDDQSRVRMSNMRSLSQTEWQIFQDYTGAITNIVALEKELSMSNSLHIAATLLKIFQLNDPQVEIPLFRTEEGRYLATSLGDPLIKGLTEVANKRPADPITYLATYLYNFANQNRTKTSASSQTITVPGKNDSNNNSIEGIIKEDSDKELEGSANTVEIAQIAQAVANIDAQAPQSPMAERVEEQMPPSPDSGESSPSMDNRDEHGQSMLHFACARSHGKNAIIQLIEESGTSITYRDELYRTARDVSLQATQPENAREIDRYVLGLAARGDLEALTAMLLDGYDHIVDVAGTDGTTIVQVASTRGHREVVRFLESIRLFEENREKLLSAIREKDLAKVKEITQQLDGAKLARTKNYYGRCSMHVAVLMESEEIVEYLATHFRATLKIGDNLERTPLHYAMGISNVEAISRILIKNGAKRVSKDLKGRQPSYYFMNKADILRLQEEERE